MWKQRVSIATLVSVLLGVGVATQLPVSSTFESDWPFGDPRRCVEQARRSNFDMKRFEVLPGLGWDNLRNLEAGMVVNFNFTKCKETDDGNLLIPDNVFTVPIKASNIESLAEIIDHWINSTSTTSRSVNVNAGLNVPHVSVSGKFSYDHEELKSKQIEDLAVTVRVQLRHYRYEVKLQPDSMLSPEFKSRLWSIAAHLELNQTDQARYKSQLLVRDFGTHVLTSVTAGAGLVKDDYLKREFVETASEDKKAIQASASASFFNVFNMGTSYSYKTDNSVVDKYNKSVTQSFIKTHGGPVMHSNNMTIDQWADGIDENLVPMDRSGDPLYFMVTPKLLPELPPVIVSEVAKYVREAIELYYEMNVIPGCTKLGAPNFSFDANFDDGSCHAKATNLTFGGVYQTCAVSGQYLYRNPCTGLDQVNPKTGSSSCPAGYTSVLLHTGKSAGISESRRSCHSCWLFFECCHTDQFYSQAVYNTYWCAATGPVPSDSGYLFGGLFTQTRENPVTHSKGCPPNFYPRQMFADLSLCISDDFELDAAYSIPFGGFFSCDAGNPLSLPGVQPVGSNGNLKAPPPNSLKAFMAKSPSADAWPMKCPDGYSQHLATMDQSCAIHYCVRSGALSGPTLPPIKRPPFMMQPPTLIDTTDNVDMFDIETQTWMRNDKAQTFQRSLQKAGAQTGGDSQDNSGMSAGAAAGLSVGVTLICVLVATLIVALVHRRRTRGRAMYRQLADETREPRGNYGSTGGAQDTVIPVQA